MGWLDAIFVALSIVGYAGLVWVVLASVLAARMRRPILATTLATAGAVWSADIAAALLKRVFDRPRPFETLGDADPLLGATLGASMPSAHAATSFAGAVILSALFRRWVPAFFLLATAIAFSRVYVGVHYPLDILAGAMLGAAFGAAVAVLVLRTPRRTSAGLRRSGEAPPTS
ncbi:MAG: phosphatase PAP2 family protein [Actinobacteria bacterium]|nr:phosphatase PAP2 family protein [Actinomycetota bacterium]